jgi:hypothetical protein
MGCTLIYLELYRTASNSLKLLKTQTKHHFRVLCHLKKCQTLSQLKLPRLECLILATETRLTIPKNRPQDQAIQR